METPRVTAPLGPGCAFQTIPLHRGWKRHSKVLYFTNPKLSKLFPFTGDGNLYTITLMRLRLMLSKLFPFTGDGNEPLKSFPKALVTFPNYSPSPGMETTLAMMNSKKFKNFPNYSPSPGMETLVRRLTSLLTDAILR